MFAKKKVFSDFSYNLLASLITTGVMQIIVYPFLASVLGDSAYGLLLTVMGFINTAALSVGNTLNNVRLIENTRYDETSQEGDFIPLLVMFSTISSMVILVISILLFDFSVITYICIVFLVILLSARAYYMVAYRIILDFKKNLICCMYVSIGYIIGIMLVYFTNQWPLVFITAELFGLWYLKKSTDLFKERFAFTDNFKTTFSKFCILMLVTLSGNVMLYLDRMIIYPILGSATVSIYTVAAIGGKTLGIVMTPISGVLLGYFSQKDFRMTVKRFWIMNGIVIILASAFMILSCIFAPIFTKILYPSMFVEAKKYIFYANLATVIGTVASMAQPAVLKFAPTYWQIIKEGIYGVIYVGLGIVLLKRYYLMGFCIATIFANLSKVIILYLIGTIQFYNMEKINHRKNLLYEKNLEKRN